MADVFISYAREDRERAQSIAHALEQRGWSVWWDREIPVGGSFSDVIERELMAARCVIVLWSGESLRSPWVQNEAREGLARHVLVPVLIEEVRPPLEFRHLQTAALQNWEPGSEDAEFEGLVEAVQRFAQVQAEYGGVALGTATVPSVWYATPPSKVRWVVPVIAVLLVLILLLIAYLNFDQEPVNPVVETTETSQTQTETQQTETQQTGTQQTGTQQTDTHSTTTGPPPVEPEFTGVGKLLVGGRLRCTAFLISATRAVTAKECVLQDATMTLRLGSPSVNHVVRPVAQIATRSYALLALEEPAAAGLEHLKLRTRRPKAGEEVYIGDPRKRVVLKGVNTEGLTYAPTGGSVGAPVISVEDGTVLGIHMGRSRENLALERAILVTTTSIRPPIKHLPTKRGTG